MIDTCQLSIDNSNVIIDTFLCIKFCRSCMFRTMLVYIRTRTHFN